MKVIFSNQIQNDGSINKNTHILYNATFSRFQVSCFRTLILLKFFVVFATCLLRMYILFNSLNVALKDIVYQGYTPHPQQVPRYGKCCGFSLRQVFTIMKI